MAITGGCLCGAVRYSIDSDKPKVVRTCWCRLCQKVGAGSATVNAVFDKSAFSSEGELTEYACTADSGNTMRRYFCPKCGVHVCTFSDQRPGMVSVRAGTLDDREIAAPQNTIWTSEAPSWALISEKIPRSETQPDLGK